MPTSGSNPIKTVGIVGGGVIGSGWAARCLAHGLDVIATDPAPNAEKTMRDSVKTMTVSDAAKLPIYDNVRGTAFGGMPADQYFAATDGARPDPVTDAHFDRLVHQRLYERRMEDAWRGEDKAAPATMQHNDNGQSAYEKRLADAWKTPAKGA